MLLLTTSPALLPTLGSRVCPLAKSPTYQLLFDYCPHSNSLGSASRYSPIYITLSGLNRRSGEIRSRSSRTSKISSSKILTENVKLTATGIHSNGVKRNSARISIFPRIELSPCHTRQEETDQGSIRAKGNGKMDRRHQNLPPQSPFLTLGHNLHMRPQQAPVLNGAQTQPLRQQELQEVVRQTYARLEYQARHFCNVQERNDVNFLLEYARNLDAVVARREIELRHLTEENKSLQSRVSDITKRLTRNDYEATTKLNQLRPEVQELQRRLQRRDDRIVTLEQTLESAEAYIIRRENAELARVDFLEEGREKSQQLVELKGRLSTVEERGQSLAGHIEEPAIAFAEPNQLKSAIKLERQSAFDIFSGNFVWLASCTSFHKLLCDYCREKLDTVQMQQNIVQSLDSDFNPCCVHSGDHINAHKTVPHLGAAGITVEELQQKLSSTEQILEAERAKHFETTKNLLYAEDKIRLQDGPVKHSLKIRRRFIHRCRKGQKAKDATRAGNEAAHDGDVRVDTALLSLGVLDPEEKAWYESTYGFPADPYLGSYENLMRLSLNSRRDLELINLRGSIFGPLSQVPRLEGNGRLAVAARRFFALEEQCQRIRNDLRRIYGTETEVIRAYEDHEDVNVMFHEMREITRERQRIMQRNFV
ncbi:hypothetical protein N431DRAFT_450652 [Stipitochalara longipes BDJ]|nr:hypothetical protein N431DRAFT_450652 [Stipitochalara longipes BDJ]